MRTFTVVLTQTIQVTLDETKFTDDFCAEFNTSIRPFDSLREHAAHLAWVHGTGLQDLSTYPGQRIFEFVEGYGPVNEMGISATTTDVETDVTE